MLRAELFLQFVSRRSLILWAVCLLVSILLGLLLQGMVQAGLVAMDGFDYLGTVNRLLFQLVLPILAAVESVHQMRREYDQRTLRSVGLAGVSRGRFYVAKVSTLAVRLALVELTVVAVAFAFAEAFGMDRHPLLNGLLLRPQLEARFLLVSLQAFWYLALLEVLGVGLVVSLGGRGFEANVINLALVVLVALSASASDGIPGYWLIGTSQLVFSELDLAGRPTMRLLGSHAILLAATCILLALGGAMFHRRNIVFGRV